MIGERIKQVRKELKINQQQFANLLGITERTLRNYEKGEREIPHSVIQKLTHLFNINPTWLLTGQGSMFLQPEEEPKDEKEKIIKEFADYLRAQDYEDVKTFWEFVKRWKSKTPSRW